MLNLKGYRLIGGLLIAAMIVCAGYLAYADHHEEGKEEEDERAITQSEVPPAIMSAAEKEVPGGKFQKAEVEKEHGQEMYEVAFTTAEGQKVEVKYLADGTLIEREEKIPEKALPASVKKALEGLKPAGSIVEIEKKTVTVYEIKRKAGEKFEEIKINASGRVISSEQEEDDD
jgi:uncharacterized membrane protein YkoI